MKPTSIREMLYEPPGPAARKRISILTWLAMAALVVLTALVIRQFAVTGQLDARYWSFFARATTWHFLGEGLLTTLEAAVTGAGIAFALGFLMMRGKLRGKNRPLRFISTVLIEFTRGVPHPPIHLFLFLGRATDRLEAVAPSGKLLCLAPFHLRCGGGSTPFRCQRGAQGTDGGRTFPRSDRYAAVLQGGLSPGNPVCDSLPDCRTGHCAQGYHIRLYCHLRRPDAERQSADIQL